MFNKITNGFMEGFINVGDAIISNIDKFSFEVCLLVGLVALVLSVFGYEKGKKISLISPAVYTLLQIFLKVWFGV